MYDMIKENNKNSFTPTSVCPGVASTLKNLFPNNNVSPSFKRISAAAPDAFEIADMQGVEVAPAIVVLAYNSFNFPVPTNECRIKTITLGKMHNLTRDVISVNMSIDHVLQVQL